MQDKKELEDKFKRLNREEQERVYSAQWSMDAALKPENRKRNRYGNILPWDKSRVHLKVNEGENDYINASFIDLGSKHYIATQGPLPNTIGHFWHMVFDNSGDPAVVVMLTPLQENHRGLALEKSSHYWPTTTDKPLIVSNDGGFADELEVRFIAEQPFEHYELRELVIKNMSTGVEKTVHHFHYQSWEDFGNPKKDGDLLKFINLVNEKATDTNSPIVVHCSAGIGRTGTYVAIDSIVNGDLPETLDPVYDTVTLMRQQRIGMVQSFSQFVYVYDQLKLKYTS